MEERVRNKMKKKIGLEKIFNLNIVAAIVVILFLTSLIPIIHVGLFNFPTGDDYWFGIHTYRGLVEEGIIAALRGSLRTVAEFYENWQGTWFTLFLFTLSPNHFVENAYIITVFLSLGLLLGSYFYLAAYYLVGKMGFSKASAAIIVCLVSYLSIQYIPRTTSGIYWFNGIMHYSVPFFLGTLAVIHSHKFIEKKRKKDYLILFFAFVFLGGGSYLAPLAATLTVLLIFCYQIKIEEFSIRKKSFLFSFDKRNLWIFLALLAEFTGLFISFVSPGNSVRGGEEFGFSIKWALECIYYAIDRGIYLGEDFFLLNGITTITYVIIAILLWYEMWKKEYEKEKFKLPLLFVIYMNGIYWATYTPEIYSRSDVSGGVDNTYFHIFLLVTLANMIYVHGWIQGKIRLVLKRQTEKKNRLAALAGSKMILAGTVGMLSCLAIVINYKDNLMTTNDYCIAAIKSGELQKYKAIREEQHKILREDAVEDAVVPEMAAPYPLLHMELGKEPEGQRNVDRAKYYDKNSVRAELVE